jgi:hypothetical protein
MIKKLAIVLGALAVFALPGGLSAATLLTLTGPIPDNSVGPQSSSNPCIIAGTTCQQPAGFGYNNFVETGAISSYNMYSEASSTNPQIGVADGVKGTPYTVAQLTALGSTSFKVAIDVNTTGAAGETLQSFEVLQCATTACTSPTLLYFYTGPTVIGGVDNNGNGYGDWTLDTVNLAGHASTDLILFHAFWNNASDGSESFFLIPQTPVQTPEPTSIMLIGAGLTGLGLLRRRFNKN